MKCRYFRRIRTVPGYTYDINTNTNYNSDAEVEAGQYGMLKRLVYSLLSIAWQTAQLSAVRRCEAQGEKTGPGFLGKRTDDEFEEEEAPAFVEPVKK